MTLPRPIRRLLTLATALLLSWCASAQNIDTTGCYQQEPMPMSVCQFQSVGVDTVTERIRLTWRVNASAGVAGYCICTGSPCLGLDTLWGAHDTTCLVASHDIETVHQYCLFAIDSCLHGGEMTQAAANMVLHVVADSCSRAVRFSWNAATLAAAAVRYKLWLWADGALLTDSTDASALTLQLPSSTMHLRARLEARGAAVSAWSNSVEADFLAPGDCDPGSDTTDHPVPAVAADPYVPNCFTPALSTNSSFRPIFPPPSTPDEYMMRIYNRNGSLVFQTHDIAEGWRGDYRGTMLPQGTYVYYLTYRFADDLRKRSGTVVLIR